MHVPVAFRTLPRLMRLCAGFPICGDFCHEAMVELIGQRTRNLEDLSIPYLVFFSSTCWDEMISGLRSHVNLKTIRLGCYEVFYPGPFDPRCVTALFRLSALTSLRLGYVGFGDTHMEALAESLATNTNIERVQLDYCFLVTEQGLQKLHGVMQTQYFLQDFDMDFEKPECVDRDETLMTPAQVSIARQPVAPKEAIVEEIRAICARNRERKPGKETH